ncbi:hypothetical protein [Endozoicomonas sp.]|uniref:hypothetical protein n=1 Tax=Endozoicomonas sp. TaxID=1892382 RepID=UPI00383B5A8F
MGKSIYFARYQDPLVLVSKDEQREALDRKVKAFLLAGGEIDVLPPAGSKDILKRVIEQLRLLQWR